MKEAKAQTTNQIDIQKRQNQDEGLMKISLVNYGVVSRKKKICPLKEIPSHAIDYKNIKLLDKFLSERGKLYSSRLTNVAVKKQRLLAKAIKHARYLALISPVAKPKI